MTPERFRRVDQLVSLALERPANERAEFIREACAGEEDLRIEVESLLASHEKEDEFPAEAAAELAAQLLAERGQLAGSRAPTINETTQSPAGERPDPFVGRVLSHYRIDAPLGSGGMGAVYRATDVALARAVAIKVLPHELANNETAKARFVREARAASALDHPNIGTIYEIGEQDGELFIAMALYEGQTLKKRLEEGALPLSEAVEVLRQMSKGLEAAHNAGIIHRDIKPANVMLTSTGALKILDFGLAKLAVDSVAKTVTQTGQAMGTLLYMSPEQLKGEAVDLRGDLWSLGVVGYEVLSGVCPFRGESNVATAMRILGEQPPSLSDVAAVPSWLAAMISQLLQKDPAKRLGGASEVISRLDQQLSYAGPRASQRFRLPSLLLPKSKKPQRWSTANIVVTAVSLLLIATAGWWSLRRAAVRPPDTSSNAEEQSIAVLPFANMSDDPENEYFGDGIAEDILTGLSKLQGLHVSARMSSFAFKGKNEDVRGVGRSLGVKTLLLGGVRRSGRRLRITAQLINASSGYSLWAETYDRDLTDLFLIQDEITKAIIKGLRVFVAPETVIIKAPTLNIDAYDLYLRGRYFLYKSLPLSRSSLNLDNSLEYFRQAIEKDSRYALAYLAIAETYIYHADVVVAPDQAYPQARAAALHALEIDGELAEAHALLGTIKLIYEWDFAGAKKRFEQALLVGPTNADAHYGDSYYLTIMGRAEEALAEFRKAQSLDRGSLLAIKLDLPMLHTPQYDATVEQGRSLDRSAWDFTPLFESGGSFDESRRFGGAVARGVWYVKAGQLERAREIAQSLERKSETDYVDPTGVAAIYAALKDTDSAFKWLEKAFQAHSGTLVELKAEPGWVGWESLRSDSRYGLLLEKLTRNPAE
jgi:serine/threonine protein kinase/tetratricopeptide (TPR) repeat protein